MPEIMSRGRSDYNRRRDKILQKRKEQRLARSPAYLKALDRSSKWREKNRNKILEKQRNKYQPRIRPKEKCVICGNEFTKLNHRQKCCTPKCGEIFARKEKQRRNPQGYRAAANAANKRYKDKNRQKIRAESRKRYRADIIKHRENSRKHAFTAYYKRHEDMKTKGREASRKRRQIRLKTDLALMKKIEKMEAHKKALNEAKRAGLTRYLWTPCRKGHSGLRYVANGTCVECTEISNKSFKNPENPKDEMQWLRKSQALLRNLKRTLKNPRRAASASSQTET